MKKRLLLSGAGVVIAVGIVCALFYFDVLHFNNPSTKDYPVRGVDVSHYQGEIDWGTLADQKIQFAYLKATEGSSYLDPYFLENWKGAKEAGLKYGAYHFFSYDGSGSQQAEHYIASVPMGGALPPVIDLKFYGDKEENLPQKGTGAD